MLYNSVVRLIRVIRHPFTWYVAGAVDCVLVVLLVRWIAK